MNEQELLLKTNNELSEISQHLYEKIKKIMETDKNSPKIKEYFDDLQTVMTIRKERTSS